MKQKIENIFHFEKTSRVKPGYAVGIIINNRKSFYCNGYSNLSCNTEITENTGFHIASITKHFTASIFRMIEKEGLVSENDLLSKYFNNYNVQNENIRIKHLLSHESGLRDQWDLAEFSGWSKHDPISNDNILSLFQKQAALNCSPGSRYIYCNTGYTLLAILLEKVTGERIGILLEKYITSRLKLTRTNYYSYDEVLSDFANAYTHVEPYRINKPNFHVTGSTSMYSCVQDLIAFEKSYHGISEDGEPGKRHVRQNTTYYKNGLIHVNLDGLKMELHSGWDYGYSSFLLRLVDYNMSIVLLCNSGIQKLFDVAIHIAASVQPDILKSSVIAAMVQGKRGSPKKVCELTNGTYLNKESNTILEVLNGKELKIGSDYLVPINKTLFFIAGSLNKVEIAQSNSFTIDSFGSRLDYLFLPKGNGSFDFTRYVGVFYSEELNVLYNILYEDQNFVLQGPKFMEWNLTCVNEKYFTCARFTVAFQFTHSQVSGFSLSTARSWNLYFKKIERRVLKH